MDCKVCDSKKEFLMDGRLVCLHCDELTFDIAIECEEPGEFETTTEKKKAA